MKLEFYIQDSQLFDWNMFELDQDIFCKKYVGKEDNDKVRNKVPNILDTCTLQKADFSNLSKYFVDSTEKITLKKTHS